MIKPIWQAWHDKSKVLLESQPFKDYKEAIKRFKESKELRDYVVARVEMTLGEKPSSEEEISWMSRASTFTDPFDIESNHEMLGEEYGRDAKYTEEQ